MRPTLWRFAAALFVLAAAACKSGFSSQVKVPHDLRASLIAVYPFGFRWPEPAYRSFELSQRLIAHVLDGAGDRARVYGPSEFQLYRAEDDNVLAATTLGRVLAEVELRPAQVVVLRPWAERRVQSSSRTLMNDKGQAVGADSQEETRYVGHVEVLHAATGEHLVEVTGEAVVDPFAARDDEGADPVPELTALMEALTREALAKLEGHLASASGGDLSGYELDSSAGFALAYEEPGRPAATGELARMDALDRELFVTARTRFANPDRNEKELFPLVSAPAGLYVRTAPSASPVRAGDVLVMVNGEPALPQTWARARMLPGADVVRVRRQSGDDEEVTVP